MEKNNKNIRVVSASRSSSAVFATSNVNMRELKEELRKLLEYFFLSFFKFIVRQ